MAELTEDQKREVVIALARFTTPTEIVRDFRSREIEVTPRQIGAYDPTRSYYEAGDSWREIFEAHREAYLRDVQSVPVANQAYRLNLLQKGINAAEAKGNWVLAAQLAEQAAKEVGGALTNERVISKGNKAPWQPDEMEPEERRESLKNLLVEALAAKGKTVHEGTPTPQ